jgi:ribosomal 50S subunit-associated protein YjgA (DUF615 family)
MIKASKRVSKKNPAILSLVDQIMSDLDIQMHDSEIDRIAVHTNEWYKKYKFTKLSKNRKEMIQMGDGVIHAALTKLKTLGYDVRQNTPGMYYISW